MVGVGEQYADLVITVNADSPSECTYLIELKYVGKTQVTQSKIRSLVREARDQVLGYRSALEFRNQLIRAYAMIFAGSDCVYCQMQK